MRKIAIILAGGKGSRMNSDIPKQYMLIKGKPVLFYSINTFEQSLIDEIILVTGQNEIEYCKKEIVDKYDFKKVTNIVAGGSERYFSVLNGLRAVTVSEPDEETFVFIHDGARPCVTDEIIENCFKDVRDYKACVAAVQAKDTIKLADAGGFAKMTPERSLVWQVQTPQCFEYRLVKNAYEAMAADNSRGSVTDDAMVVEKYTDIKVKLTPSSYENIKITTPEDLFVAERFLTQQK